MRKTIYLGLGGTGVKAIASTRKMFEDIYGSGNLPTEISFLAFDFELNSFRDGFLPSDCCVPLITAVNPREFFRVRWENEGEFGWMPVTNVNYLDRTVRHTSTARTSGRLFMEIALLPFMQAFECKYNKVLESSCGNDVVDVYIVASLAGGTGGGIFIPVAQAIKEKYVDKVRVYGYGVLHSIFHCKYSFMFERNSVASVLDLNYFMKASSDHPVSYESRGKKSLLTTPVYDGFVLVDECSENGLCANDVNELCSWLGVNLYLSCISSADRPGWIQRVGMGQIVYKGFQLAECYAMKAAQKILCEAMGTWPYIDDALLTAMVSGLDHEMCNSSTFECDLSLKDYLQIDEILSRDAEASFLSFNVWCSSTAMASSKDELIDAVLEYSRALPQCQKYKNVLVTDILDQLSPEEFSTLMAEAAMKSSPLLVAEEPSDVLKYANIFVYQDDAQERSRLRGGDVLKAEGVHYSVVPMDSIGMKQRIVFCRRDVGMSVADLDAKNGPQNEEYRRAVTILESGEWQYNPHMDYGIYKEIVAGLDL